MGIIRFLFIGILSLILLIAYLIVAIGGLWVLRVAIDWWLDIDYVRKIKEWIDGCDSDDQEHK